MIAYPSNRSVFARNPQCLIPAISDMSPNADEYAGIPAPVLLFLEQIAGLLLTAGRSTPILERELAAIRAEISRRNKTEKPAIASSSPDGRGPWQLTHQREYPSAELPFLRPLSKIAGWQGIDATLVVSHIESPARAMRVARACKTMIARCSQIRTALGERYPEALRHE